MADRIFEMKVVSESYNIARPITGYEFEELPDDDQGNYICIYYSPDPVTEIGDWNHPESLIEVEILKGDTLTTLEGAFIGSALRKFSWNGDFNVTNLKNAFNHTNISEFPQVDTTYVTTMENAWANCSNLTSFPNLDLQNCTSLRGAWSYCTGLTSFPQLDTIRVEDLSQAWKGCENLTTFPLIDTRNVTTLEETWSGVKKLAGFPRIDTRNVTNFHGAWYNCESLNAFPNIDVSSGVDFESAWETCKNLTSFPNLNFGDGEMNFSYTWKNCESLIAFPKINLGQTRLLYKTWYGCNALREFPKLDTTHVVDMQGAWTKCWNLTSFPEINTENCHNFQETWFLCSNIHDFPLLNFRSAENIGAAWNECRSLEHFPPIDFSNVRNADVAWDGCHNLIDFSVLDFRNLKEDPYGCSESTMEGNCFMFKDCPKLLQPPASGTPVRDGDQGKRGVWRSHALEIDANITKRYSYKSAENMDRKPVTPGKLGFVFDGSPNDKWFFNGKEWERLVVHKPIVESNFTIGSPTLDEVKIAFKKLPRFTPDYWSRNVNFFIKSQIEMIIVKYSGNSSNSETHPGKFHYDSLHKIKQDA